MAQVHIFGDESGDFALTGKRGTSRYFMVTTVTFDDDSLSHTLHDLRRELHWSGDVTEPGFHAQTDSWPVRKRVFDALSQHDFRIDSTILKKANAQSQVTQTNLRFWKTAWFYHLKWLVQRTVGSADQLFVVAASIDTKMKLRDVRNAIDDVVAQVSPSRDYKTAVWPAPTDLGLQAADYCGWAIQRYWETGNRDAYDLIKHKICSEFPVFGR